MSEINLFSWEDDWDTWVNKYIASGTRSGDIDLVLEKLGQDIYHFPLFSQDFCHDFIAEAERQNLWSTDQHDYYPTTDVLLKILGLAPMYSRVLETFCHPIARKQWTLEGNRWLNTMHDESLLARYKAEDQQLLSIHQDYSDYTFTVGLNTDFEGGGTWFPRQQILGNPRNGYCTLFPCVTHPHGGRPTTKGTRYIIVSFCRRPNLYIDN